ncbi:MAG: hypothetical protein GY820_36020 [Gammaproteobacteria bacterium]|nr:hypothetical protein [Gammaproteobacteria bacterium]
MPEHQKIDYVEYPSSDLEATKSFLDQHLNGALKITVPSTRPSQRRGWTVAFINQLVNYKSTASKWYNPLVAIQMAISGERAEHYENIQPW